MAKIVRALVLLLFAVTSIAQEIAVPVDIQAPLLLKILTYERRLQGRRGEPVRLGILYQSRVRESRDVFEAFREAVSKRGTVSDRAVEIVPIDVGDEADVARQIGNATINVLYVTPLRAVRISTITEVTRRKGIVSLTGVPGYVDAGLSVGIDLRAQRPRIVINLAANRAEGAEFSAQLLNMARIVQ